MVVDTTTTLTLLSGVATESSPLTSMFPVALPQLKLYFMDFFSYRRRSTGARISSTGGPNEALPVAWRRFGYISME